MDKKRPIVYVTRDIERALGMEPSADYMIVSNDTPYGQEVKKHYPEYVFLIKGTGSSKNPVILDTFDLLIIPSVSELITSKNARILVFQNNPRIEKLASDRGWTLLNPSANLSRKIEEKVSQIEWLGCDANLLPPHKIMTVKEISFNEKTDQKKFVLQFNHSHTGEGTYVIDLTSAESVSVLNELKNKFPNRPCRIVDFIDGPIYTMNVVCGPITIYGAISYQITGLKPFTDLPFSTIGNDWSLGDSLSNKDKKEIKKIARTISCKMRKNGWRGLFGIDVVKDSVTGKIYLLEINARQPASTTYESQLATKEAKNKDSIFKAHILALESAQKKSILNKACFFGKYIFGFKNITAGAQIVQRITNSIKKIDTDKIKEMRAKGFTVIEYSNTEHNKELYRTQSTKGIMSGHNQVAI